MQPLPIQALPNQSLTVILDNNRWDISLRAVNGAVAASLTRNGVIIAQNTRVVAGMRILPYEYQEDGNFVVVTQNGQIVDYTQFNVTQSLIYVSQDELDALRIAPPAIITAAFFNPLAELPLRFAPQGYTLAP